MNTPELYMTGTCGTVQKKELRLLRLMFLSRFADEKMSKLTRQNKGGTFFLSCAGHELVGVVCGSWLIPEKDWSLPYYRDQSFALSLGCALDELIGSCLGRAVQNHSGGRMMPHHYSHKKLRILCQSSVVGSQFLHAAGRGLGIRNLEKDEVVYVSAGEGATSQGDFHEALNFAALHQLPVIFVIQDNGWAISVPSQEQTAGKTIGAMARGYLGLKVHEIDGTDYQSVDYAMAAAVARGRNSEGPSLIIAQVPRLAAHSNSDDPSKYQTVETIQLERKRDPIPRFERWLLEEGLASPPQIESIKSNAFQEVEEAALRAQEMPFPEKGSGRMRVFAPFSPPVSLVENKEEGGPVSMMDALNHALDEEMALDPHVVVFGQDVAHGKGGVFGITRNLTKKYGVGRCFNTPLAESTIIGISIGLCMDGLHKPVAEIQFADYIWTGINQLFNEASSIYYRSDGHWNVPIVIRMPCGGYIQGGPYHSQSIEGYLAHCPGLKIAIPSNASDAKRLLKTAIRDPNPVLFLEHKALYRQQKYCPRPEPDKDSLLPFGQAQIVHPGHEATVVCWGMMVVVVVEIAKKLKSEGISIEVIDLRTLVPLDSASINDSVKKTGKLLIVQEAPLNCGFGAEIAARVANETFHCLDGPILRIGGFESAVPYSKSLENEVLPQEIEIEAGIRELVRY